MSNDLIAILTEAFSEEDFNPHKGKFLVLPETNTDNLHCDELTVLVHPYNQMIYLNKYGDTENPLYEEDRDELVRTHKEPILIGLDYVNLENSLIWLKKFNFQGPRVLYLTKNYHDAPIHPEDLNNAVKKIFNPSKVRVCGAEVHLDSVSGEVINGCVNGTYFRFSQSFKTLIDLDYC